MSDLSALREQTLAAIAAAADEPALEAVRVAALGKKGSISALLATLGKMSPDERRTAGAAINALKDEATEAITARRAVLKAAALEARLKAESLDVTLPVRPAGIETGRIHPISQVIDEITAIFADMGFAIAEGPDIESDDYNFTKLNFPPGHPAREMHDTFFFAPDASGERKLLRTHTSPVQVRTMLAREAADPRHLPRPHLPHRLRPDAYADVPSGRGARHRPPGPSRQPEMAAGGVLQGVLRGEGREDALPPELLPLHLALGRGRHPVPASGGEIRFGEGEDWLEILGCGMVHANVLRNCGIDPDEYQGFAWGMGIDRIAMLKYGLPDLRDLFDADLRWIRHYGFRPLDIPTLAGGLSG